MINVPFQSVEFPPDEPGVFRLMDVERRLHHVPFHRIREVFNNGRCIWRRELVVNQNYCSFNTMTARSLFVVEKMTRHLSPSAAVP